MSRKVPEEIVVILMTIFVVVLDLKKSVVLTIISLVNLANKGSKECKSLDVTFMLEGLISLIYSIQNVKLEKPGSRQQRQLETRRDTSELDTVLSPSGTVLSSLHHSPQHNTGLNWVAAKTFLTHHGIYLNTLLQLPMLSNVLRCMSSLSCKYQ